MGEPPDASTGVVFVNFHSEHLILPKATMLAAEGFRVVVADNSGTFPDCTICRVQMDGNEGFAAACNRGVQSLPAGVRIVCFHNPDVDAGPEALWSLRQTLEAQRLPGAVAPAERVGSLIRERGYHYPSLGRELAIAARGVRHWRSPTLPATTAPGTARTRHPKGPRFAGGGLLLVSRSAHEAIGGFDEQYFLYVEDLDYWHRLGLAGFQTEFDPRVIIDHESGTGSPLGRVEREVLRWVGVELFIEKSTGNWRPYRHVHRALLRLAPTHVSPLISEVRSYWGRDTSPSATSDAIRSFVRRAPPPT